MATITHTHEDYHHHQISTGYVKKDILFPLRRWVDGVEIRNAKIAHLICRIIPCCCPFERDITLFGHTFHIPPLCKLNPLYDEFVGLRFRSLTYLSDVCGEDVTKYIC
ncbi:MAG: Mo-dependent nitrogenase C-terminal domain-containing protein [Coleofasciculus sp. S288]|nr:Mo-dependent nitrogenase C-terminal domain-containing protein [Coleofasciculus sp. S288]